MSGDAPPTLILANARIATGNPERPWATALAISGGSLAALGSAAEILKTARAETRVLDAGGRVVTLPAGARIGRPIVVSVNDDGAVTLQSPEEPAP